MLDRRSEYASLSLVEILGRIVDAADAAALEDLHEHRRVCRLSNGQSARVSEYIETLRDEALVSGRTLRSELAEVAANLTLDKFLFLPVAQGNPNVPGDGPDCRKYFAAVLRGLDTTTGNEARDPIAVESKAAWRLQGLIDRHFKLSVSEARRTTQRLMTRYTWKTPTGRLTLLFPSHLAGAARRAWLEANVGKIDAARSGERERVQQTIDLHFGRPSVVRLDEDVPTDGESVSSCVRDEVQISLAAVVAEEKARNLDEQRPAIRELGQARLAQLILCIFESLENGEYRGATLADRFGLSRSALSRFAGSRWRKKTAGEGHVVPDLWANTAATIAARPDFVAAARAAGVWSDVDGILDGRVTIRKERA